MRREHLCARNYGEGREELAVSERKKGPDRHDWRSGFLYRLIPCIDYPVVCHDDS